MEEFGPINGEEEAFANQSHVEALKTLRKGLRRMNVCQCIRMFGFPCVSGSALVKMNLDQSYSCFWMSAVCLASSCAKKTLVTHMSVGFLRAFETLLKEKSWQFMFASYSQELLLPIVVYMQLCVIHRTVRVALLYIIVANVDFPPTKVPRGKRAGHKPDLLMLYEFVTGRSPTDPIEEEINDLQTFDDQLSQDAARRGHRLRNIILPPDYDQDGLIAISLEPYGLIHNFINEFIQFDEVTIAEIPQSKRPVIYSNWNESQAVFKVPGTSFKIIASTLFKNHFASSSKSAVASEPATPPPRRTPSASPPAA